MVRYVGVLGYSHRSCFDGLGDVLVECRQSHFLNHAGLLVYLSGSTQHIHNIVLRNPKVYML